MDESVTISLERYHDLVDAVKYYSDFHKKFLKTLEILENSTENLHINLNKTAILSLIKDMSYKELTGKTGVFLHDYDKYEKTISIKE